MEDQLEGNIDAPDSTQGLRPPMVTDHDGRGWQAVTHGGLTPHERRGLDTTGEEYFADQDSVRLTRRGYDRDQISRFTIDGARALAQQLGTAADLAERRRNTRWVQDSIDAEAERLITGGRIDPNEMAAWAATVARDMVSVPGLPTVWADGNTHIHYRPCTDDVAVTGYHTHPGGERHVHGEHGWSSPSPHSKNLIDPTFVAQSLRTPGFPDGAAGTGRSNGVLEEGMAIDGSTDDPEKQALAEQLSMRESDER